MAPIQKVSIGRFKGSKWFYYRLYPSNFLCQVDAIKSTPPSLDDGAVRISSTVEPHIAEKTASQALFKELMTTYYIPLETWYTRTTIDKVLSYISPFSIYITHTTHLRHIDYHPPICCNSL